MPRVDIHTHLLPGVDDGPESMDDTVEMARLAAADGTEIILATPHQRDVMIRHSIEVVQNLVVEANGRLRSEAGPTQRFPRIILGMENHIEPEIGEWYDRGIALPINGTKFILSEPPFGSFPKYVEEALRDLRARRLVPIIAHPERNAEFQRHPGKLRKLIEAGMLAQITAGSLLGEFGDRARRAAEYFIERDLAHIIASDMHRPVRIRIPQLSPAFERAVELVGEERSRMLFEDTPRNIIDGRDPDLSGPRPALPSRRRWLWPFSRDPEDQPLKIKR